MILAHLDSYGDCWYFRIDADRKNVASVARKLKRTATRVKLALNGGNKVAISRAKWAEATQLFDLKENNGATVEDYQNAPQEQKFML